MAHTTAVIILAGAPDPDALDWHSPDLLADLQEPIARFAGLSVPHQAEPSSESAQDQLAWRSIMSENVHLPTGFSQQHSFFIETGWHLDDSDPDFVNVSFGASSAGEDQDQVSQFYEHSFAAYHYVPSSQLEAMPDDTTYGESFISDEQPSFIGAARDPLPLLLKSGHLSDLEDIPPASYLQKDNMQTATVTCNIIVGIISIAQTRTVRTRYGRTSSLVEVLVGDETKSGFDITFWLPADGVEGSLLAGLRQQDVVLIQNVALNVFKNKVYGYSLRKNYTKVHLLCRRQLYRGDDQGYYGPSDLTASSNIHPQLAKTKKVWDWVLKFVGLGINSNNNNKATASAKRKHRHDELANPVWDRPPIIESQ
jgi:hypothetical protein